MRPAATERELARWAVQLIGSRRPLTHAEKGIAPPWKAECSKVELAELRKAIHGGLDPLGADFLRLRSSEKRRASGAVYTPPAIVDAMMDWAATECGGAPKRVVDPGSGSGRFTVAAAVAFPKAELIAIENDPLSALILRANATVLGFAGRLKIHVGDYRTFKLLKIDGRTLFIGNPPYVRHHQISERAKQRFAATAARLGFRASKLAGLHVYFYLRTRELSQPGDFGAFITSSEWIDVNYGSVLRTMLADGLGGTALHIFDPEVHPFDDALTTGAIVCFHVGNRPEKFTVRAVSSLDELKPLGKGKPVDWGTVTKTERWSTLVKPATRKPSGMIELGELFRVHRGQVTGGNAVWIAGPHADDLPERYLAPAITKARELFAAGDVLTDTEELRRIIDLPADLLELDKDERRAVERFLAWAKRAGADRSYTASHRRAWWSVGLKQPAAILCTYMARRAPHFVRNAAEARHINIAHGLYPREPISESGIDSIAAVLRAVATTDGGRVYAGGLVKFEPKELERIHIPRVEDIHGYLDESKGGSSELVSERIGRRRTGSHERISGGAA